MPLLFAYPEDRFSCVKVHIGYKFQESDDDVDPDFDPKAAEAKLHQYLKEIKKKPGRAAYSVDFKLAMVAEARRAKNVSATSRKFGLSEKRIRLWQRQEERLKNPDDGGKRTKKSYTAAYKLAAVQTAKHTSVAKAAKKLGVPEKCVRFWQQQEDTLKTVKQGAKKVRNFTPRHPEFEENVKNWVVSQHEKLLGVTTRQLQSKGAEIAKEMNLPNLLLNKQWCYRFIKRQQFGWNGQNILPEGFSDCDGVTEKIATFRDEIYHKVTELSIDTSDIINVDEMLLTLDLSSPENGEQRSGLENIMALESVLSELSFTVVLGVTATGEKKLPMMVFKSQSAPSGSFPDGVIVRCSETVGS